jgi:hypothetical protein
VGKPPFVGVSRKRRELGGVCVERLDRADADFRGLERRSLGQ